MQDLTVTNTDAQVLTERTTGGPLYVQAAGTWGGTTLTLRASYDGGITKTTLIELTEDGFQNADIAQGSLLELQAVGGSGISLKVMIR